MGDMMVARVPPSSLNYPIYYIPPLASPEDLFFYRLDDMRGYFSCMI
jgi:hypothetical protein